MPIFLQPPPRFHLLPVQEHALRHVRLFGTLWTAALQAPLSMESSRQEDWSGWPLPSPGHLPDPGIEPRALACPALAGGFFTTSATWAAFKMLILTTARFLFLLIEIIVTAGWEAMCSLG